MTLAGSSGGFLEENAPLAGPTVVSRSTIPKNGDRVRRRLAFCVFLYVAGAAIVMQIYPKVSEQTCVCVCVCAYEYVRRESSSESAPSQRYTSLEPSKTKQLIGTACNSTVAGGGRTRAQHQQ